MLAILHLFSPFPACHVFLQGKPVFSGAKGIVPAHRVCATLVSLASSLYVQFARIRASRVGSCNPAASRDRLKVVVLRAVTRNQKYLEPAIQSI